MGKEIKAKKVMVCSAKTGLNIEKVFEEAARVGLNAGKKGLCSTHWNLLLYLCIIFI